MVNRTRAAGSKSKRPKRKKSKTKQQNQIKKWVMTCARSSFGSFFSDPSLSIRSPSNPNPTHTSSQKYIYIYIYLSLSLSLSLSSLFTCWIFQWLFQVLIQSGFSSSFLILLSNSQNFGHFRVFCEHINIT